MTLCPGALLIGCKNCPIVKVCPGKTLIGNYQKEAKPVDRPATKE